jgi:type I restriction enzyme S subunit
MGRFGRVWGGWGMAGNLANQTTFEQLISEGALEIGDGYRAKNDELGGDGLIFLRAGHVNDTHIDFEGVDRFQAKLAPRLQSKIAQAGDTVITTKGNSTGRCTFISPTMPPFVYSPHLSYWRSLDLDKLEPGFLRYWCKGSEFGVQLSAMKASTDMAPYLSLGDQKRLRITLPPISEQRAIAHILGNLDDKIELNRRMNATLEAMARAIFKSWFVDFDPVRAKAEGRAPEGLAPEIAALFPDGFEDSIFGEVPRGWKFSPLGSLVDLQRGNTYKSSQKGLPGPVLLGLASIERNGGFRDDKLSTYGGTSSPNLILGPGDLFVSLKDVTQSADLLGAIAKVPPHIENGRLTQDTVKLIFKSPTTSRHIVYRTLLTTEYRDYCRSHATGTTNLGLSREDFLAFPIIQANDEMEKRFGVLIESLESQIANLAAQSRTLATLRDTLLPKLLSGEIRVGQVSDTLDKVVS